jgi:hypothetical protein
MEAPHMVVQAALAAGSKPQLDTEAGAVLVAKSVWLALMVALAVKA